MTERDERHSELVRAGQSAMDGSDNAAELWKRYRKLAHAFQRDFPDMQLPQTETNESDDIEPLQD